MPTYTHIKWEAAPSGWELWGIDSCLPQPTIDDVQLLAWVFQLHARRKWSAIVYDGTGFDTQKEFDTLEDAQAWCVACVRVS